MNAWSILVPQALAGVAAVGVLYAAVRRWHGPAAGLLAGAVLALTPVAVLMFRFNNPDALLVLLLTMAAYALIRALEAGRASWLVAAAVFLGFGFLIKMMQAFLVVPGFALTYLVAAPVALRQRIGQLLAAGVALLVSAGWWVALVELWPAALLFLLTLLWLGRRRPRTAGLSPRPDRRATVSAVAVSLAEVLLGSPMVGSPEAASRTVASPVPGFRVLGFRVLGFRAAVGAAVRADSVAC